MYIKTLLVTPTLISDKIGLLNEDVAKDLIMESACLSYHDPDSTWTKNRTGRIGLYSKEEEKLKN